MFFGVGISIAIYIGEHHAHALWHSTGPTPGRARYGQGIFWALGYVHGGAIMAKRVPKDEKCTRKASVSSKTVWLTSHTVKEDDKAPTKIVYEKIGISYPDMPDGVPAYIPIAAAASHWIKLQGQIRKMTEEQRLACEGKTFTAADIVAERVTVDDVTKASRLLAKLTPTEKIAAFVAAGMDKEQAERIIAKMK